MERNFISKGDNKWHLTAPDYIRSGRLHCGRKEDGRFQYVASDFAHGVVWPKDMCSQCKRTWQRSLLVQVNAIVSDTYRRVRLGYATPAAMHQVAVLCFVLGVQPTEAL